MPPDTRSIYIFIIDNTLEGAAAYTLGADNFEMSTKIYIRVEKGRVHGPIGRWNCGGKV